MVSYLSCCPELPQRATSRYSPSRIREKTGERIQRSEKEPVLGNDNTEHSLQFLAYEVSGPNLCSFLDDQYISPISGAFQNAMVANSSKKN
jgi:hypothetical protein